jgi:hypothetical protein
MGTLLPDLPRGIHERARYPLGPMSKRTQKKKAKVRRAKANHGRKPNLGRNS